MNKKGLTESYLAVNCYFYDEKQEKKNVLILALKLFPHPHYAENIKKCLQKVIQEYNIDYEKIFKTITYNGSNMVKAFKLEWRNNNHSFDDEDKTEFEFEQDFDEEELTDDFDDEENNLNREFKRIKIKRIPCVNHLLQCAIKTCEKQSKFKDVIQLATKLINKFRQSSKLAEILKEESE